MDANKTQALSSDPNRTQLGAPPVLDPNKTVMGTAPTLNATVTIKPVQCIVCKTFNPAGVMFCVECGLIFDRALPDDAFGAPAVQLPMLVEQSGKEHPVRPGINSVGREGDITIPDPKVSRRHAQVLSEDNQFLVEDLGSTNGTYVNGDRLGAGERRSFGPGDTLSFGGVELKLTMPGALSGQATQTFASNKTAAISAPPKVESAPGKLVGEGKEFALKLGMNSFGRKTDNDIAIVDPYVSGKHGIIELAEDGIYLTDIGSTNGTMLNDAKLGANMRTRITEDDVIRLGSLKFQVKRS